MTPDELKSVMVELQGSRGWKAIMEDIEPLVKQLEISLLGDDELPPDVQKERKITWRLYKKFINYPDFLVAKSQGSTANEPNTDPYA